MPIVSKEVSQKSAGRKRECLFFIFTLGSSCVNGFSHVPSGGVAAWATLKVIVKSYPLQWKIKTFMLK